jgi:hypothetical protein
MIFNIFFEDIPQYNIALAFSSSDAFSIYRFAPDLFGDFENFVDSHFHSKRLLWHLQVLLLFHSIYLLLICLIILNVFWNIDLHLEKLL